MYIVPVYCPGGAVPAPPIVSVPPILICVRAGGAFVLLNGDAGYELPICKLIEPPLLPVSVASGPFSIEIIAPGGASISKMAL